jgi:hypothetical protein
MFKKTIKSELKNQIKLLSVQNGQNYETYCTGITTTIPKGFSTISCKLIQSVFEWKLCNCN